MAAPFPASDGLTALSLDSAWGLAGKTALSTRQQAAALNAQIAAGPVNAQAILNSAGFFGNINAALTRCAAVPGIAAYAQAQVNDPTFDAVASFGAMQQAVVAVVAWITTNFPKDVNGNLLAVQFNSATGQVVWTSFPQASLAPLAALLTALLATITAGS